MRAVVFDMQQFPAWEFETIGPAGQALRYRLVRTSDTRRPLKLCSNGQLLVVDDAELLQQVPLRVLEVILKHKGVFHKSEILTTIFRHLSDDTANHSLEVALSKLRRLFNDVDRWSEDGSERWTIIITSGERKLRFNPRVREGIIRAPDDPIPTDFEPCATLLAPLESISPLEVPATDDDNALAGINLPLQYSVMSVAELREHWKPLTTSKAVAPIARRIYVLEEQGLVIGRKQQIEIARDRWFEDQRRPLLIYGPAGIGKSVIVLALLHELAVARRFGNRRFRMRCDRFSTVDDLIASIGNEWFDLPLPTTELEVLTRLSDEPCAVALDGYETLLRSTNSDTREAAIRWLQKLLGINELPEKELWLIVGTQGHQLPMGINWAKPLEPPPLSLDDAVELYGQISRRSAHASHRRFRELLNHMAGLPRAIELLAAQAQDYPLFEQLLERWESERTGMLTTGAPDPSPAESVDAMYSFAISNPFLLNNDRKLLRILALFPAGIADADLNKVMDGGLRASGTLYRSALAYRESGRLKMLAPQREYLSRPARRANDEEKQQAIDYFLTLASTCDRDDVLVKLLDEYPNCIGALQDALINVNKTTPTTVLMAAAYFARFSAWSGLGYIEGFELAARALHLAQQNDDKRGEGWCLLGLGEIAAIEGEIQAATHFCTEAQKRLRGIDKRGESYSWFDLGMISALDSRFEAAKPLLEEAQKLFQGFDKRGEGWCLWCLAEIAVVQDRIEEAKPLFWEAHKFLHGVDNLVEGKCLLGLGEIERAQGRHEEAKPLFEEAKKLFHDFENPAEGICLLGLGEVALLQGRREEAKPLLEEAQRLLHDTNKQAEGRCLLGLAITARANGRREPKQLLRQAQTLFQACGDKERESLCVEFLRQLGT